MGELIVTFFEHCNLSCQMCPQVHTSTTGMDTIREQIHSIKKSILAIKKSGKVGLAINLMGGELLQDFISDEIFSDYSFVISEIRKYAQEINFPTTVDISTNLVFNKTERVKNFLDENNIKLNVSYDPIGRFNVNTFLVYKKNIDLFKDYITKVSVVMTKPTLETFIRGRQKYFEHLYNNFEIVFDHYSPEIPGYKEIEDLKNGEDTVAKLTPSDVLLRDFYIFMFKNWNKCTPFSDLSNKEQQPMFCMQTVTITPESSITSCETFEVNNDYKPVTVFFGKLESQRNKWMGDYDCLSCEHMQRCTMGCFSVHMKSNRTQQQCWLKEVYDTVDYENSIRQPTSC